MKEEELKKAKKDKNSNSGEQPKGMEFNVRSSALREEELKKARIEAHTKVSLMAFDMGYDKGFQAGKLASQEKCLKMIEGCKCYCEFCAWGEEHEEKDKLIKAEDIRQKIKNGEVEK